MSKVQPPRRGLVTEAVVTRVIDGDTVEIQPLLPATRVRLLDCWAPERRTDEGRASTANMRRLLMDGQRVLIEVPGNADLDEVLTFGRVLARIWIHDNDGELENVSELQVEAGHATEQKGKH